MNLEREDVMKAYKKVEEKREWLYLRARPWRERIAKYPFSTIRYALGDKYYYFLTGIRKNPLILVKTFWGSKMRVGFPDYRSILHHGLIDARELAAEDYLVRHLSEKDIFFDIGANVGFYSLLAQALGAKVHAFEPTPKTFEILKENTDGITLVPKAIMDKRGTIQIADFGLASGINTAMLTGDEKNLISVEAMTLDEYCEQQSTYPTYIKIDTEGAEHLVIAGGKKTLMDQHPILIVETFQDKVMEELTSMGYQAYQFPANGVGEPAFYNTGEKIHNPNLLFLPK
jgi:FkbM family methyltransferase